MILTKCASFDPGLNFGLSAVERTKSYHVHYCKAVKTDPDLPKLVRYRTVFKEIELMMRLTGCRHLAIEENEGAQIARSFRPKDEGGGSSSTDGRVMVTVGAAIGVCCAYGYTCSWFEPRQAKIAILGKGNSAAKKTSVRDACKRLFTFAPGCQLVLHSADSIAGAVWTLQHASELMPPEQGTIALPKGHGLGR